MRYRGLCLPRRGLVERNQHDNDLCEVKNSITVAINKFRNSDLKHLTLKAWRLLLWKIKIVPQVEKAVGPLEVRSETLKKLGRR